MSTSDWIALGSFGGALLAALYARWSATAAQRANEIALHNERLKIFRGFLDCRAEITAHGDDFSKTMVHNLYSHVQLTEFYFDTTLYQEFRALFDIVFEIDGLRSQARHASVDKADEIVQQILKLLSTWHEKADRLEESFRKRLRLAVT